MLYVKNLKFNANNTDKSKEFISLLSNFLENVKEVYTSDFFSSTLNTQPNTINMLSNKFESILNNEEKNNNEEISFDKACDIYNKTKFIDLLLENMLDYGISEIDFWVVNDSTKIFVTESNFTIKSKEHLNNVS